MQEHFVLLTESSDANRCIRLHDYGKRFLPWKSYLLQCDLTVHFKSTN